MTLLWLICLILVIVALVPFVWSQVSPAQGSRWTQEELNKSLYYRQVEEWQQAAREGVVDNEAVLIRELQQRLLQDVPVTTGATRTGRSMPAVTMAVVLAVILGSMLLYRQLGSWQEVDRWLSVSERLPQLASKVMAGDQPVSADEIQDFTLALRTRLAASPEDAQGWYLLGRLAMSQQQLAMAMDAFERAYRLVPANPQFATAYVQALTVSGDPTRQQLAQKLIQRLLEAAPEDPEVWSAYAFMAYEQQRYPEALTRWRHLLDLLSPDDERYSTIQQTIAFLEKEVAARQSAMASPVYQVTVSLADGVALPQQGTLFVFAQRVAGPAMPLAAKKLPLGSFPVSLTLSDTDAMMPQATLSQADRFVIKARVSEDEDVAAAPGDWQGRSGVIEAASAGEPIHIVIDSQFGQ